MTDLYYLDQEDFTLTSLLLVWLENYFQLNAKFHWNSTSGEQYTTALVPV